MERLPGFALVSLLEAAGAGASIGGLAAGELKLSLLLSGLGLLLTAAHWADHWFAAED